MKITAEAAIKRKIQSHTSSTQSKHTTMLGFLAITLFFVAVSAEQCCSLVGCFQNSGIFSHLPLPNCPDVINPQMGMYTRDNQQVAQYMDRHQALPSVFEPSRRTTFLVHGFLNNYNTNWLHDIKDALLEKEDMQVVIVGWGNGHLLWRYTKSASNIRPVGAEIALMIDRLKSEAGGQAAQMYCVGFSLGAHVCGHVGMRTHIGRITGLDPAGPLFERYDLETGLNPGAADLVDVIHTDGRSGFTYYGTLKRLGHRDFYPNNGRHQPGCWFFFTADAPSLTDEDMAPYGGGKGQEDMAPYGGGKGQEDMAPYGGGVSCSHSRAPLLYLESVRAENCFIVRDVCTDENDLPSSCTSCSDCAVMGFRSDSKNTDGIFYLTTTRRTPYCNF